MYEIGPFRLDPAAKVLLHGGAPVQLGTRAVDVLALLVERRNEHVPKSHILDAAWPGRVVEESNLNVQISAIRRVLARVPGGESWVETLPRRGYRFVGPVCRVPRTSDADRTETTLRSNLPAPLTAFIGRARETDEIEQLLSAARLLTLVGIGGIGKTRLAQRVAAERIERFRDGVWFVDFAPLGDPALVASAVARALNAPGAGGPGGTDTLCAHLRGRELLLVLDNCEHVREACAELARALLLATPGLTILATSREPLEVEGEQAYPVPPLSLPEPEASADAIARSDAVQLFLDRARLQRPHFHYDPALAPAIAGLCTQLDGIPLALELAAGRVRSLSVEQILERLGDRFRLLSAGARALPRQRTLLAALDWSYDLLTEQKRAVLRRCAIFSGGFTLEAAVRVAGDEILDAMAVTDLLGQLVGRSLVIADTDGPRARYHLLETARAYAFEKLAAAGEVDAARRAHSLFFRDLFARAPHDWLRMSDVEWRALYVPELDNVRTALDWALTARADVHAGVALAGSSGPLWTTLSLWTEGARRLEEARSLAADAAPRAERARLALWLGVLHDATPDLALAALEEAAAFSAGIDDRFEWAHARVRIGRVLARMGRLDEAAAALEDSRALIERSPLARVRAFYHGNVGYLHSHRGEAREARAHIERSAQCYREAGAEFASIACLSGLADATWALGDLDAAAAAFRESIALLRKSPMGRQSSLGFAFGNLAGVLTERGDLGAALAAAREALRPLSDNGYAWHFMDHFALRTGLAGHVEDAARLAGFADASFARHQATREPNEARARMRLHRLLEERLSTHTLVRLLAEGADAGEPEACRLAAIA